MISAAQENLILRRAALTLLSVVVAVAGTVLGWRIAGPHDVHTSLGSASINVAPSFEGTVDVYVPIADWGIRADSFDSLFRMDVEVRTVDRRGALEAAAGDRAALQTTADVLEDGAKAAFLRAFLYGLFASIVLASAVALIWHRWRFAFVAVGIGAVGVGLAGVAAVATFDAKAFASPSFYGRGEELAQLVSFFERQRGNDRYSSTFEDALGNFSAYLTNVEPPGGEQGRAVLIGSDIHSNALVLPPLSRFAEDLPVLLAGDFGHEGNEAEAELLAPRIADLGEEVIAVSGNHDSRQLMASLAAEGVTVLGTEGQLTAGGRYTGQPIATVDGLQVAGFADPLEWQGENPGSPARVFSFQDLPDGAEREEDARQALVAWFQELPQNPDLVLVHQNALAQHLAATLRARGYEKPLAIVTGHNHLQHIDRYGSITVVNGGTLGAGGPLRVGQEFAGLGHLHLQAGAPVLDVVDLVRIEPLSGQAEADRAVLDLVCPPEDAKEAETPEPCHYEPSSP